MMVCTFGSFAETFIVGFIFAFVTISGAFLYLSHRKSK